MIPQKHQYIFSTSIEKDLIHQWAYYGSQEAFCIEFDREELINLFYSFNNKNNYYYGPVLYADNYFKSSINNTIKNIIDGIIAQYSGIVLEELDNLFEIYSSPKKKNEYRKVFHYFYSLIKQYGHYCEREYRFTLQNNKKPEFRIRKGLFVPYLEIPFEPEKLISQIIIGPNNREELAERNLRFYLKELNLESIKISQSRMKIR